MKKRILGILLALVLVLCAMPASAVLATGGTGVIGVNANVYTNVLVLENKDWENNWSVIADGIGAKLYYNAASADFEFALEATGLPTGTPYSLIYYSDTEDRYNDWGGANPGAVIWSGESDSTGAINYSGSKNLNMDLPCPPDANAYFYNYAEYPDNYANATGAKIWLIPTAALSAGGVLPVQAWPPNNSWLFETDLITYDDTDVTSAIVAISVSPTSIDFGNLVVGVEADGGTVTVTNIGGAATTVTADATGIFADILLDGNTLVAYSVSLPGYATYVEPTVKLTPSMPGSHTGTLTFMATATS